MGRHAPLEEVLDPRRCRLGEHWHGEEVEGRTQGLHRPVAQEKHTVGERNRLAHVVGHVQRGHPPLVADTQQVGEDALAERHIERRERLVEEQEAGVARERAREGHPLLLAPREGQRVALEERRKLERLDGRVDARAVAPRAEADIPERRQMGQERRVLRHVADAPPLGRQPHAPLRVEHHLAADRDAAARPSAEAGEHLEKRRLARARRSHDRRDAALEARLGPEVEAGEPQLDRKRDHAAVLPDRRRDTSSALQSATKARTTVTPTSASARSSRPIWL